MSQVETQSRVQVRNFTKKIINKNNMFCHTITEGMVNNQDDKSSQDRSYIHPKNETLQFNEDNSTLSPRVDHLQSESSKPLQTGRNKSEVPKNMLS